MWVNKQQECDSSYVGFTPKRRVLKALEVKGFRKIRPYKF